MIDIVAEFDNIVESEMLKYKQKLVQDLKNQTPVDTGKARDGWQIRDGNIVNDVDYIDQLNEGSSQQAPKYFVESTLLQDPGVKSNGTIIRKV